tara:strand:+ start:1616 stop:1891 length:276 start_codon:yes stop_codon:yes gene_type:complete
MPRRPNGYVSRNYQRDWTISLEEDIVKVTTDVEVDVGDKVVIETDIPKISETGSYPKSKKSKKKKIAVNQEEGIGDRIIVSTDEIVTDDHD